MHDLGVHKGTPYLSPPTAETHDGFIGRSSFESTEVAVAKTLSNFQLALETVEKNRVAWRVFDLKFLWAFIGLSDHSAMGH